MAGGEIERAFGRGTQAWRYKYFCNALSILPFHTPTRERNLHSVFLKWHQTVLTALYSRFNIWKKIYLYLLESSLRYALCERQVVMQDGCGANFMTFELERKSSWINSWFHITQWIDLVCEAGVERKKMLKEIKV